VVTSGTPGHGLTAAPQRRVVAADRGQDTKAA